MILKVQSQSWVKGTALAMTVDCNSRMVNANPEEGCAMGSNVIQTRMEPNVSKSSPPFSGFASNQEICINDYIGGNTFNLNTLLTNADAEI